MLSCLKLAVDEVDQHFLWVWKFVQGGGGAEAGAEWLVDFFLVDGEGLPSGIESKGF